VLQKLQDRYRSKGFRVLGFPCHDFAGEEPDDLGTIKAFCAREYGVTYELFDKLHIRENTGYDVHPLYRWLTAQGDAPGPVSWNFEKFLLDRQGNLIGRWPPKVAPDDKRIVRAIEGALKARRATP
jgi:glutathione peroxidase